MGPVRKEKLYRIGAYLYLYIVFTIILSFAMISIGIKTESTLKYIIVVLCMTLLIAYSLINHLKLNKFIKNKFIIQFEICLYFMIIIVICCWNCHL